MVQALISMLGNEHKGTFSRKSKNIKLLLKIVDLLFIPLRKDNETVEGSPANQLKECILLNSN